MDVLIEELDENPEIAIAGSKLLYPDETIQHAGVVFADDKTPYHIYSREIKEKHYVNKKRKFKAVTAACMLVRKDLFDEVGGFDEIFFNGYEDIDLCLKIKELGKDIIYCPESVVYHFESISEGRGDKHIENQKLFLKKWGNKIQQDDFNYMNEDSTQSQYLRLKNQELEIEQLKELLREREKELEYIKSTKFIKIMAVPFSLHRLFLKYLKKINYLLKSFFESARDEGLKTSLLRIWNFAVHGKGVLDSSKINKEETYVNLKEVLDKFIKP
jgi:predicted glycosyltransferase involved in capsule biosynthesis